ncbi:MAG: 6-bladed beta-propeller [Ignavibacterium sp.]|jgi:hypothetical protein|nr:6-bladed beta-propeller [Ignavibacterium sp.]
MRTFTRLVTPTILFLIMTIAYSCKEHPKSLLKEYAISTDKLTDSLQNSIKSYTILKLDNHADAYFKFVSRFIITDLYLLFKDESKQSIIIYDKTGKYINSITKKGRGPEEYMYISDFMFNEKTKEITICDRDKLKKYSFEGDYISEQKYETEISRITRMKNGNLVAEKGLPSGNPLTDYHLKILTNTLELVDKRLQIIPTGGPGFGIEGQTYRTALNKDYAYFFSYNGDTIYHISQNKIEPVYLLKYDRDIITTTDGTGTYKSDPEESYRQLGYYELGDICLLTFNYKNMGYCYSFNQLSGQSKCFYKNFPFLGVSNNQLVIVANSMYLNEIIKRIDPGGNRCKNRSDLDNALQNQADDFQVVFLVDLELFI